MCLKHLQNRIRAICSSGIERHEVGGRRQCGQAETLSQTRIIRPSLHNRPDDVRHEVRIFKRSERPGLCDAIHTVVVPHFLQRLHNHRVRNRISDPGAGHPVRLGERAHPNDSRPDRRHRRRGVLCCEFRIRFIQDQQTAIRQCFFECTDIRRRVPCARGVVRIGQVHHTGSGLHGGFGQSLQIVSVIPVRHEVQEPAEPVYVVVERRVRAKGRYNRLAGLDENPHDKPEEVVDSASNTDVLERNTVEAGDCGPDLVVFRIVVPAQSLNRPEHCLARHWRNPESTFVCPHPYPEGLSAATLQRFGPHERHRCRQAANNSGKWKPVIHYPDSVDAKISWRPLTPNRKNSNSATRGKHLKRGVTVVKKDVFSVHVQ